MSLFLGQDFEAKSKGSEEALRNVEEQAADSASVVRLTNCFLLCLSAQHFEQNRRIWHYIALPKAVVITICDLNTLIVQHDIQRYFIISAVIITKLHFY